MRVGLTYRVPPAAISRDLIAGRACDCCRLPQALPEASSGASPSQTTRSHVTRVGAFNNTNRLSCFPISALSSATCFPNSALSSTTMCFMLFSSSSNFESILWNFKSILDSRALIFGANLESRLLTVLVEVGLEVAYFGIHIHTL